MIETERCDVPSNLLNNVPHESSALAQVTLGSGNTRLDNAGGGFLNCEEQTISASCPSSAHFWRAEILHEVRLLKKRRLQRTWPLLVPTIRPERAGASLAILDEMLEVELTGVVVWLVVENGKSGKWLRAGNHEILGCGCDS